MMPLLCPERNLPCFFTEAELREWYDEMPAITVDLVYPCQDCGGYHAHSHHRDDGERLTAEVEEHNRRLSQMDSERYNQEGTEL